MDAHAKPWWQSLTIWGVIVAGLSGLLGKYGVTLSPEDQSSLVAAIVAAATPVGLLVGVVLGVWGRIRADKKISASAPPPNVASALVAVCLVSTLGLSLGACSGAQMTAARDIALQVGRTAYAIECKTDLVGELGGAVVASIKAPDSKAATKIREGLAANRAAVAIACPLATAVEIVVAPR